MHVQASLPMPLFDPLLPTADAVFPAAPPSTRLRKSAAQDISRTPLELQLSLAKLHERLALLAQLELPCTIVIANPPLYLREAVIQTVELADGSLTVGGSGFSLCLRGSHIHSISLSSSQEGGGASLDILHSHGMLYASIQPAPEGPELGAVWRDVMDNPSLALA